MKTDGLSAELSDFYLRLAASQRDLSPESARILRDNLWLLYDDGSTCARCSGTLLNGQCANPKCS